VEFVPPEKVNFYQVFGLDLIKISWGVWRKHC